MKNYRDCLRKIEGFEIKLDASSDGIRKVIQVQQVLAIGKELMSKGIKVAESGLLISGYTEKQMKEFVTGGGNIFISKDVLKNRSAGYLLASNPHSFFHKYVGAKKWWLNGDMQTQYESLILNNDYVYLDQIGILFEYHGTGLAEALLETFEVHYEGYVVVSLVISEPIDNIRSKGFFLKNGYETICEIVFPKYGTIENFKGILVAKKL